MLRAQLAPRFPHQGSDWAQIWIWFRLTRFRGNSAWHDMRLPKQYLIQIHKNTICHKMFLLCCRTKVETHSPEMSRLVQWLSRVQNLFRSPRPVKWLSRSPGHAQWLSRKTSFSELSSSSFLFLQKLCLSFLKQIHVFQINL